MAEATRTGLQRRNFMTCLAGMLSISACSTPNAEKSGSRLARHHVLLTDGTSQLDVIVEGQGPALVLLPSSQRDSEDFDDLAALLATAGYKILRPQPRGMGASRGPMGNLSLHTLAADTAMAIRELGDGRAVIVGHAFGHYVARVTDLEHSAIVRGVVVAGGAARQFPSGMAESLAVAADPSRPQEDRLKGLRHAFFAPGNSPASWLNGWHPELKAAYRSAGVLPPKEVWWPVSNSPILDLQGDQDPWRPPSTRNELKEVLGNKVTVKVIHNASHALIPEQPEAVSQAIVAWVQQLPR